MPEIICKQCGKIVKRVPSKIKRSKKHFCSLKCFCEYSKKDNHPSWKGGKTKRICPICGDVFFRFSSISTVFCSRKCYGKWCSTNRIKENNPNWQGGKLMVCPECGTEFWMLPRHIEQGRKYCSLKCARKHFKFPKHHTKPELIFQNMCKKNNLHFKYVGDGSLWIGKKGEKQLNPDFIEANGQKVIVEVFGDYWHSPLLRPQMREEMQLNYRKRHYKKYKWHSIFLWESDLKREDAEQFILNILQKEGIEIK